MQKHQKLWDASDIVHIYAERSTHKAFQQLLVFHEEHPEQRVSRHFEL